MELRSIQAQRQNSVVLIFALPKLFHKALAEWSFVFELRRGVIKRSFVRKCHISVQKQRSRYLRNRFARLEPKCRTPYSIQDMYSTILETNAKGSHKNTLIDCYARSNLIPIVASPWCVLIITLTKIDLLNPR